jgi:hypothetical protein
MHAHTQMCGEHGDVINLLPFLKKEIELKDNMRKMKEEK